MDSRGRVLKQAAHEYEAAVARHCAGLQPHEHVQFICQLGDLEQDVLAIGARLGRIAGLGQHPTELATALHMLISAAKSAAAKNKPTTAPSTGRRRHLEIE